MNETGVDSRRLTAFLIPKRLPLFATLTLLCSCVVWGLEDIPPVKEGDSHVLHCSGSTSRNNSHLQWIMIKRDMIETLSRCNDKEPYCHDIFPDRYTADVERHGLSLNSSLKIKSVSHEEERAVFECIIEDINTMRTFVAQSWNLWAVYFPPQSAGCEPDVLEEEFIQFNCSTSEVYPGINCSLRSSGEEVNIVESKTFRQALNNSRRYSASCSMVISPPEPGTYQTEVEIVPAIQGKLINGVERYVYSTIKFYPKQVVKIRQQSNNMDLCPGRTASLQLECRALWFPSDNSIVKWYLNDALPYTSCTYLQEKRRERLHIYSSSCTINPLQKEIDGTLITCNANISEHDGSSSHLSDSFVLKLRWPPSSRPYFRNNDGNTISSPFKMPEGSTLPFYCEVEGGKPLVLSVHVRCTKSGGEVPFWNQTSTGTSQAITFNGSKEFDGSTCTCSAYHITGCYNLTSTLFFAVGHVPSRPEDTALRRSNVILYIVIGFLIATFVPITVAVIASFRKVMGKHYSVVAHFSGRKKIQKDHHYEPVAPKLPRRGPRRTKFSKHVSRENQFSSGPLLRADPHRVRTVAQIHMPCGKGSDIRVPSLPSRRSVGRHSSVAFSARKNRARTNRVKKTLKNGLYITPIADDAIDSHFVCSHLHPQLPCDSHAKDARISLKVPYYYAHKHSGKCRSRPKNERMNKSRYTPYNVTRKRTHTTTTEECRQKRMHEVQIWLNVNETYMFTRNRNKGQYDSNSYVWTSQYRRNKSTSDCVNEYLIPSSSMTSFQSLSAACVPMSDEECIYGNDICFYNTE